DCGVYPEQSAAVGAVSPGGPLAGGPPGMDADTRQLARPAALAGLRPAAGLACGAPLQRREEVAQPDYRPADTDRLPAAPGVAGASCRVALLAGPGARPRAGRGSPVACRGALPVAADDVHGRAYHRAGSDRHPGAQRERAQGPPATAYGIGPDHTAGPGYRAAVVTGVGQQPGLSLVRPLLAGRGWGVGGALLA